MHYEESPPRHVPVRYFSPSPERVVRPHYDQEVSVAPTPTRRGRRPTTSRYHHSDFATPRRSSAGTKQRPTKRSRPSQPIDSSHPHSFSTSSSPVANHSNQVPFLQTTPDTNNSTLSSPIQIQSINSGSTDDVFGAVETNELVPYASDSPLLCGELLEEEGMQHLGLTNFPMQNEGNPREIVSSEREYEEFLEAVRSEDCAILQLSRGLFIVNGWNSKTQEPTSSWYHLRRARVGTEIQIYCACHAWQTSKGCLHSRYLSDSSLFPPDPHIKDDENQTFLISRSEGAQEGCYTNILSVPPSGVFSSSKSRALVEYYGEDDGQGTWKCLRDRNVTSCDHIVKARHSLQQHLRCEADAQDSNAMLSGELQYNDLPRIKHAAGVNESVSHILLPPPVWARIRSDPPSPHVPVPKEAPEFLPLSTSSTCLCQSPRIFHDTAKPTEKRECIIYSLTAAWKSTIEVQRCSCQYRFIGPDCSDAGLFNWNNRILFTHDLLDDYTSSYTTSETPFVSWVIVLARRYERNESSLPFVSVKTFRSAWFSYINLVSLENDMSCPQCGPSPDVTIWDGVTLAFNRKNLMDSLEPPTTIDGYSECKEGVKSPGGLQVISNAHLRRSIRSILETKSPGTTVEDQKTLQDAYRDLQATEPLIAPFFYVWLCARRMDAPPFYHNLMLQILAEETTMQLMNWTACKYLLNFIHSPNSDSASYLTCIPALHKVVQYELGVYGTLLAETVSLCQGLYVRGKMVYSGLTDAGRPPADHPRPLSKKSWKESGCCYGMPQIRSRPTYPGIPNDNARDSGGKEMRGEGCQKFYAKYGESRLTGGIMCVWCTHSICYGFHCIPIAEGRNDVFSAIYTRWPKAPSTIIYDFACALQPYCMTREPEFFGNTLFAIDLFHSTGHSKCGRSSFLSTYCETNPQLLAINSSAGECGNNGLLCIRKSVSYMSQDRAVVYSKVFLCIWNRLRIKKLETGSI